MSKKKCGIESLFKAAVGTAVFVFAANFVGAVALYVRHAKKAEEHEGENNFIYSALTGKKDLTISAETKNSYVTCLSGKLNITMETPIHEDVYLDIVTALGKVTVSLPMGVQCVVDGAGPFEAVEDGEEEALKEGIPTVHISCKEVLAKLEICYSEQ